MTCNARCRKPRYVSVWIWFFIFCHALATGLAAENASVTSDQDSRFAAGGTNDSRMILAQALNRIPRRTLPGFWIGDMASCQRRIRHLKAGTLTIMERSPGRRPLHLIEFGQPEHWVSRANFNSAIGAREPSAYCDKSARQRPVIFFLGPVHGHEVEGLTGLINLIHIMETGRDLRGHDQSKLQALGQRCRLLIMPTGNPDGVARFAPHALQGMTGDDLRFWGQGTWSDNTFCGWPQSKRQHPMVGANVGFLGCYFNNKGINPMHDEFFQPMSGEAPAILRVAKESAPDLVVSLHSHENRPAVLRPAYVPFEVQSDVRGLAQLCYRLLEQRQLPHDQPFALEATRGEHPDPFNLTSALYHISGAISFTFECPHGLSDTTSCPVSFDQILDIQLTLYEAMIQFALDQKH
jgi:hypothetical protein